jgi:hypothetical protein
MYQVLARTTAERRNFTCKCQYFMAFMRGFVKANLSTNVLLRDQFEQAVRISKWSHPTSMALF